VAIRECVEKFARRRTQIFKTIAIIRNHLVEIVYYLFLRRSAHFYKMFSDWCNYYSIEIANLITANILKTPACRLSFIVKRQLNLMYLENLFLQKKFYVLVYDSNLRTTFNRAFLAIDACTTFVRSKQSIQLIRNTLSWCEIKPLSSTL